MKKLLLIFLLLPLLAPAQTQEKQITKADRFALKAGALVEKQFIEIGRVKNLTVKVLSLRDLNSNASVKALRFESVVSGAYTTETKIGSLDTDEIDDLVKSIKNLQANVFTTTPSVYTEVSYQSNAGFEAGAYYDLKKLKWNSYVQVDKYGRDSIVFLSVDDFHSLLNLIEQAKQKL